MIRSMLSAVSGMRNHQTFLDVIGNNIANVNTIGFKASRVIFSDLLSQFARGATSPQPNQGGTNPLQVGLGMQISSVDPLMSQGTFQATGKITDLAIEGDGFFILNNGIRDFYSRDGSFDIGVDGSLVSASTGLVLQGWTATADGAVDITQPLGSIGIPFGGIMAGQASTAVGVRGNLDASLNGYSAVTASNSNGGGGVVSGVYSGVGDLSYVVKVATANATTGEVTGIQVSTDGGLSYGATIAASGGGAVAIGNGLSFAMPTNTGNAVGNTFSFTTEPPIIETSVAAYDSLGSLHNIRLTFRKTGDNTWSWRPTTTEIGVTVTPAVAQTFSFSNNGAYVGQQPAGAITLSLNNGANSPATINLNLGNLSQLSGNGEAQAEANGAPPGSLVNFSVGQGGEIAGIYTNGLTRAVGQLALSRFANPAGLVKSGKNLYELSANSGDPAVGKPGTAGRGQVGSGFLEMSNVDLALQFTNMIMAERGFQANSRVITTSDELLQDVVNLKR